MRIAFPLQVEDGRLKMVEGNEEVIQKVEALMKTRPGELPLSRTFGIFIDYNVPYEVARGQEAIIASALERWYGISPTEIRPILSEGGIVVDWYVEVPGA